MKQQIENLKQSYYTDEKAFNEAFGLVRKLIGSQILGATIIAVEALHFSDGPIGINVDYLIDGRIDELLFAEWVTIFSEWHGVDSEAVWEHVGMLLSSMN